MSTRPDGWGDRLLGFAFSALIAVLILRFVWDAAQPIRAPLLGAAVLYGFFKWQQLRR